MCVAHRRANKGRKIITTFDEDNDEQAVVERFENMGERNAKSVLLFIEALNEKANAKSKRTLANMVRSTIDLLRHKCRRMAL